MGLKRTEEFRADAVRMALTSGLTRKQVASDLGVGLSTLNKWVSAYRDTNVVSDKDLDLARENERLRRENRILKEERDILKKDETFVRHWSKDNGRMPSSRAKSHEVPVHRRAWPRIPDQGLHPSYGSWQPILFTRLSEAPAPARIPGLDERQGKLL